MAIQYDAAAVAAYFDEFGAREWDRLEQSIEAQVNLAVHTHYLRRYIQPGWRVLEIGAGAGRFTVELARLGARILVTDVSNAQLDLNRSKVTESGLEALVEDRLLLDVVDMSILPPSSFDCVVCYGGPVSYAMDRRLDAVRECVRLAKGGAPLLFSVMSLWGTVHKSLTSVLSRPKEANDAIIATGDIGVAALPGHKHYCHAFRCTEFKELLVAGGLKIGAISAATCLTTGWSDRLAEIRADDERWAELIDMEVAACAEPGCVDAGPHIIAVGIKPPE